MKFIFSIILYFVTHFAISQTIIKIESPQSEQSDFQLVNLSDSLFIDIGHMEDMGVWYGQYYKLKAKIPSGQYDIYVDDTLRLRAFMKHYRKDSIWTSYYSNGQIQSITPYKKGKKNGEFKEFYNNGSIYRKGKIIMDCPVNIIIAYHENGKISAIFYYEKCKYIKQEGYDENGNYTSTYYPKSN